MIYQFKKKLVIGLSVLLSAWIITIICAPILAASGISWQKFLARFIYFFYQPVCHQYAERCIIISDYPMAVCVRCFAFYISGLLVALYYLFQNKIIMLELKIYAILALPVVFDFIFEKLGLYRDLSLLRFMTGGLLGIVFFHILIVSISKKQKTVNRSD